MSKRASPGDGTLRQRKDGRWEYRVVVGTNELGDPIRKSFYSKDRSGIGAKKAYKEYLAKNEDPLSRVCTLTQWAPEWLRIYKRDRVSWGTYNEYEIIIRTAIIPCIGNVRLDELRPAHIEKLMNSTTHFSASRRKKIRFLIKAIMDSAVENGYCRRNPATGVKLEKSEKKEVEIFNRDDIKAILDHCETHPFGVAIKIMLLTGLRRGELCALRWFDVDLQERKITIRHALRRVDGGEEIGPTKTKNTRFVPIRPDLEALLTEIPRTSEYVISRSGERVSLSWFRSQYDSFFRGLDVERKTSHKLRHTFASYLVKGGADIREVQELLGHTEITMTEKYTHVDIDGLKKAVKKLKYF